MATAWSQNSHNINGVVIDQGDRSPISYANVAIVGSGNGTQTDSLGRFTIENVMPGDYKLQITCVGYKPEVTPDYIVTVRDLQITIELEQNKTELADVTVYPTIFRRPIESPVGMHNIGVQEIEKSPGANRDISRVVQSYPGVSFAPGYRNDLIVRGGGPSENKFYLDGIEIPNINHFSTQGASGGPVSLINADLIREVNLFTGAFPAYSSNALSSVLGFKLRDGNPNQYSLKATLGASEMSLSSSGPLGKKSTYIVSIRRSYLQLLFKMIGLPFLPTYNDAQFKIKTKFSPKHELTILGIGGIDDMKLNDKATTENAEYILDYLPVIKQNTYTIGAVYKHYGKKNLQMVTLSHSFLNNKNTKYRNNDETVPEYLMLKYYSAEQESKLRFENSTNLGNFKINAGANLELVQFKVNSIRAEVIENVPINSTYNSKFNFWKYGIFGTADYRTTNEKFTASLGMRIDGASYSSITQKLLKQFSPRLSLSYRIVNDWSVGAHISRYYQLPPLTALGYNALTKELKYMRVSQVSGGVTYNHSNSIEVSVEGFYKRYSHMPMSVADGIPLMCKGDDYGTIGNEALVSTARGKSYGIEILGRWIIARKLNVSTSLTIFKSTFDNAKGEQLPSAWDNRYIFNITGTYYLPRNWSVGAKLKSIGGTPFTPYDVAKSSNVQEWNAAGQPYFDYSRYNSLRTSPYTQLDVRVDKIFYIKKCMLGFYIDIQNITKSAFKTQDIIVSTGIIENPEALPQDQRYKIKSLSSKSATIVPTLGVTFEF